MKQRSRNSRKFRKFEKREREILTGVAHTIGSTLGSLVARAESLREKSRTIGSQASAQARTITRKTRKRLSSATTRRTRTRKRKS